MSVSMLKLTILIITIKTITNQAPDYAIASCDKTKNNLCLNKCCPINSVLDYDFDCIKDTEIIPFEKRAIPIYSNEKYLISNKTISESGYGLVINYCKASGADDAYRLEDEDEPRLQVNDGSVLSVIKHFTVEEYCMDVIYDEDNSTDGAVGVMACVVAGEKSETDGLLKSIGLIISVPFLVVTLLVYLILPDRSIPSKILMCIVTTLIVAYIIQIIFEVQLDVSNVVCAAIGMACYYFFMCSFFWMNVSCIDIYLAFRRMRGVSSNRSDNKKRFLIYIAYACGTPLAMLAIIIGMMQYPVKNVWFHPRFSEVQCWFDNRIAVFIYFYGPISCLLILNIVLFVSTAVKIRTVKKDTSILKRAGSRKHNADEKERFNIYVKLLFAMGINWSMEIISWCILYFFPNMSTYLWIVTDLCNALYGVVIFFIFVFKKKTWIQVKKRYYKLRGGENNSHTRDETSALSSMEATLSTTSNKKNSVC